MPGNKLSNDANWSVWMVCFLALAIIMALASIGVPPYATILLIVMYGAIGWFMSR